ncbi:MAG: HAMP domain-containing sensor histidine kinase, partial [Novosphingobium sp.]
ADARRAVVEMEARKKLIVENQRMKEEVARINRISAIEAMTTLIAHEMNQPIGSAKVFAQAALRWLSLTSPDLYEARKAIGCAVEEIGRSGEIIRSIRRLSTRTPSEKALIDLSELIDHLLRLMKEDLREKNIVCDILHMGGGVKSYYVFGCYEEIAQIFVNLISNSVDSLGCVGRDKHIKFNFIRSERGWVSLVISDNGSGISELHLPKVFESFFTTKEAGTGLGLSICRDIAESHGGSLAIDSIVGVGTSVTLCLPEENASGGAIALAPQGR